MSKAEKFIQDYTRNCSNLMQVPTLDDKGNIVPEAHPWLTPNQARKAVEIAREEVLNDICEWIDVNYVHYLDVSVKGTLTANIKQFIGDLKQVIRDE